MSFTAWILVTAMTTGAATQAPGPAAQPSAEALPVSLDRIRKVLSQPQAINPEGAPVFRVEVFGRRTTLDELLGSNPWKGPAPPAPGGAAMTHQEFLSLVTPQEFRGTAMYTQGEAISMMLISVVAEWALQKAIQKLERAIQKSREARKVRAREEARKEVQEALAALDRARAAAGLPRRLPQ